MIKPTIRPVRAEDGADWAQLYEGYAAFYKVSQTPEMRARVFGWLMNPDHTSNGLVAVNDQGALIGLTHYRPFVCCLDASVSCFLDDLFVAPVARGTGTAEGLISAV